MEIALHPQVNVFVGGNGSGKTSVLDAVAGLLQLFVGKLRGDKLTAYKETIEEADIHVEKKEELGEVVASVFGREVFWQMNREKHQRGKTNFVVQRN